MDAVDELSRPVALVLSGGGAQGAAQAGAAVALRRAGLVPDLIVGTSVGAWNGGWLARSTSEENARGLLACWLDPEVRLLFRGLVRGFAGALARRRIAALSDARLRRILAKTLGASCTFADLEVPLACAAIDFLTAELVYLESGSVADAVRAASAIPAVLPPVELDGRLLADAGFVDNFGITEALRRGARSIVLVDASVGQLDRAPHSIVSMLDRANLVTRIHQRNQAIAAAEAAGAQLEILEVAGFGAVLDFGSAARQLAYGREVAERWLAGRVGAPVAAGDRDRVGTAGGSALDVPGRPLLRHNDPTAQLVPA